MNCYHLMFIGEAGVVCEAHDDFNLLSISLISVLSEPPVGPEIIIDSLVYKTEKSSKED